MENVSQIIQKKIFNKTKNADKLHFYNWLIKIKNIYLYDTEKIDRAINLI